MLKYTERFFLAFWCFCVSKMAMHLWFRELPLHGCSEYICVVYKMHIWKIRVRGKQRWGEFCPGGCVVRPCSLHHRLIQEQLLGENYSPRLALALFSGGSCSMKTGALTGILRVIPWVCVLFKLYIQCLWLIFSNKNIQTESIILLGFMTQFIKS